MEDLAIYELGASEDGGGGGGAPAAASLDGNERALLQRAVAKLAEVQSTYPVWVDATDDVNIAVVSRSGIVNPVAEAALGKTVAAPSSAIADRVLAAYWTVDDPENFRVEELQDDVLVRAYPLRFFSYPLAAEISGGTVNGRTWGLATFPNIIASFTHRPGQTFRVRRANVSQIWTGGYKADSIALAALDPSLRQKVDGITDGAEPNVQPDWTCLLYTSPSPRDS